MTGADLPPDPFEQAPDRVRTWLVVASVASGVGSFVAMIWASMLLAAPEDGRDLEVGLPVLVMMVLFLALLVACIVLGYVAARRRPRD